MDDTRWMARALALAARGRGLTSPNPMVGALVIQDGAIVAERFHERAGGPHAEAAALADAGTRARGATLYVTLEPCNHVGRTPPCAEAVIRAGVRRVVAATSDPNPKVTGGGAAALRAASIEVSLGCLEREARALNEAFFTAMALRRPHVTAKWAMTLDGKIAAHDRRSRWITGEAARREAHRLRSESDAIVTGIGTVLADDPALTVRLEQPWPREPYRVVVDGHARMPLDAALLGVGTRADIADYHRLISDIKSRYPDVLFLAEAFTRPKLMYELAKMGFTQSYTYFAWRNTKLELTQYFQELTQTEVREFFRPNLWPNTPDILTDVFQRGGLPVFGQRLVLAATLGANYGIYGPAFELGENRAVAAGSEEYLESEKYQIRAWDLQSPTSLAKLIAQVNQIRCENLALHGDLSLRFHPSDNDQILIYSKMTDDLLNIIVTVVNLDPYRVQAAWVDLPLDTFHLDPRQPYQMHDLLTDTRYVWRGPRNYVELNPQRLPAHIFCIRRRLRVENGVDYFA